jgi:hypothetical protein
MPPKTKQNLDYQELFALIVLRVGVYHILPKSTSFQQVFYKGLLILLIKFLESNALLNGAKK